MPNSPMIVVAPADDAWEGFWDGAIRVESATGPNNGVRFFLPAPCHTA